MGFVLDFSEVKNQFRVRNILNNSRTLDDVPQGGKVVLVGVSSPSCRQTAESSSTSSTQNNQHQHSSPTVLPEYPMPAIPTETLSMILQFVVDEPYQDVSFVYYLSTLCHRFALFFRPLIYQNVQIDLSCDFPKCQLFLRSLKADAEMMEIVHVHDMTVSGIYPKVMSTTAQTSFSELYQN